MPTIAQQEHDRLLESERAAREREQRERALASEERRSEDFFLRREREREQDLVPVI